MDERKRKLILPMLVAIVTLGLLVVGATYAYIKVGTNINFGSNTITSTLPLTGSASITAGASISMSLSNIQVERKSYDEIYYASTNGITTDVTTVNIATIQASIGSLNCTYTMNIKADPATMATQSEGLGSGLFVLTVNHYNDYGENKIETFDFHNNYTGSGQINNASGVNISGKVNGITVSNSKNITAQLKFVNSSTADQSKLANTSAKFTFKVTQFNCTPSS